MNRDVMTQAPEEGAVQLKALAEGLRDLRTGERRSISLRADEAYGFYDPKLSVIRSRDELNGSDQLKLGDKVEIYRESSQRLIYRVTAMTSETVTLDANHPLAGQDLVFEIETLHARDATPEEIVESAELEIEVDPPEKVTPPAFLH